MRFRRAERDSPEINLTPLIDVVFLLLIFFMVSTTFEWRTELGIELPEASAQASDREEQAIAVIIDAAGEVHVQGRLLGDPDTGSLARALSSAARGLGSPPVIVSADALTPHQSVVTVMDAARRAGLYKLTFTARHASESPD